VICLSPELTNVFNEQVEYIRQHITDYQATLANARDARGNVNVNKELKILFRTALMEVTRRLMQEYHDPGYSIKNWLTRSSGLELMEGGVTVSDFRNRIEEINRLVPYAPMSATEERHRIGTPKLNSRELAAILRSGFKRSWLRDLAQEKPSERDALKSSDLETVYNKYLQYQQKEIEQLQIEALDEALDLLPNKEKEAKSRNNNKNNNEKKGYKDSPRKKGEKANKHGKPGSDRNVGNKKPKCNWCERNGFAPFHNHKECWNNPKLDKYDKDKAESALAKKKGNGKGKSTSEVPKGEAFNQMLTTLPSHQQAKEAAKDGKTRVKRQVTVETTQKETNTPNEKNKKSKPDKNNDTLMQNTGGSEHDSENENDAHFLASMTEINNMYESNDSSDEIEDYCYLNPRITSPKPSEDVKSKVKKKRRLCAEVIVMTNSQNGQPAKLRTLFDTGSSGSICNKKYIPKSTINKKKPGDANAKFNTLGGTFKTKHKATLLFTMPEFHVHKADPHGPTKMKTKTFPRM
jgi:hypothetical protein